MYRNFKICVKNTKKSYKEQLPFGHRGVNRYSASTGIHGEFIKGLFGGYNTLFKLPLLRLSLQGNYFIKSIRSA